MSEKPEWRENGVPGGRAYYRANWAEIERLTDNRAPFVPAGIVA